MKSSGKAVVVFEGNLLDLFAAFGEGRAPHSVDAPASPIKPPDSPG